MRMQVLYMFPCTFPDFPNVKPTLSPLQLGPNGLFGLAIEPVVDHQTRDTTCSFFEIDMFNGRISHYTTRLPYVSIFKMQPCYDHDRKVWILAIEGGAFMKPFDVYQLPPEVGGPWRKLFAANTHEREYEVEKSLVAFWQQGDYYPLIFCELDLTMMYDTDLRWTYWRPSNAEQASNQYLSTSYEWFPFISEDGCLLFTCQCVYDQVLSDSLYRKLGTGQWQFHIAAYAHSGTPIRQEALPAVAFPVRDLKVANNDRFDWLLLSMNAIAGPAYGPANRRTCVAALIMQDNPDRLREIKKKPPRTERSSKASRGGLYCLDMQGQILQHDPGLSGEQTSLCLCENQVLGATSQDGQWYLWSWHPLTNVPLTIHMQLPPNMRRATVIAGAAPRPDGIAWFWCVEEYEHGIRVSQRGCERLQELQTLWCEGITLPDGWTGSLLLDTKPQGVTTFQNTLLVLGLDQEKQLKLLQFQ